jgi:hypothetical protein
MTPEERELMMDLCRRIQDENDPAIFGELVWNLNELLERSHERIHPDPRASQISGS